MRAKTRRLFQRIRQLLRNGVLGVLAMAIFLLLPPAAVLAGIIGVAMYQQRQEYTEQLHQAAAQDRQNMPALAAPVLIFSRDHSPLYGNVVLVYRLEGNAWNTFAQKIEKHALSNTLDVECVKPTVKKRWRGWRKSLHFVVPDAVYLSHHDYENHNSFYVHGSTRYLPDAVRACQQVFKRLPEDSVREAQGSFEHAYWAVSESEHLLFSVYEIRY